MQHLQRHWKDSVPPHRRSRLGKETDQEMHAIRGEWDALLRAAPTFSHAAPESVDARRLAQMISGSYAFEFGSTVGIILIAIFQRWDAYQAKKRADAAQSKADIVSQELKSADALKAQKLTEIHALVNSDMGLQLKKIMLLTEQLALQIDNPQSAEAARVARMDYLNHMEKQTVVDKTKAAFDSGVQKGAADAAVQSLQQHIDAAAEAESKPKT